MNGVEHHVDVQRHIGIAEAYDMEAKALEIGCALLVVSGGMIEPVLAAIDLNDELCAQATKIGDVRTERDLPAETRVIQRKAMAQVPPQPSLSFGKCPAQLLGVRCGSLRNRFCRWLFPGHGEFC